MTLDTAPEVPFAAEIYRIDRYNDPRAIVEMDDLSPEQRVQLIRYANAPAPRQRETITRVFVPRSSVPPFSSGRFGEGTFPVLYCAFDQDTAIQEKLHHLKKAPWFTRHGHPVAYNVFAIATDVTARDLRQSSFTRDELISEDYAVCRSIGAAANTSGVAMLLSYSARLQAGVTTPLFSLDAIGTVAVANDVELDNTSPGIRILPASE